MEEKNKNMQEIEVTQDEGLQDIVKRSYPYWGVIAFVYSLFILIGCISASFEYKGQKLIHILLEPLMHYIQTMIPKDAASLDLPTTLTGEYELQVLRGNYCFWGWVE